HLCVVTCPTGIDIRDGLQMECIGCAQCIDACDAVMSKIGRPLGLIRYGSQEAMDRGSRRLLRPRVILYPLMLAIIAGIFVTVLVTRAPADVTLLRAGGRPYVTLESGEISNELRIKIVNRTEEPRAYSFDLANLEGGRLAGVDDPVRIGPGESVTTVASVVAPPGRFSMGRASVTVLVRDDAGFEKKTTYRLQGPWSPGADPAGSDEPEQQGGS
ncbi:MAG: 4Fe-4S dicluster domain-containing protein, partial [Planctomycetota bacterium]